MVEFLLLIGVLGLLVFLYKRHRAGPPTAAPIDPLKARIAEERAFNARRAAAARGETAPVVIDVDDWDEDELVDDDEDDDLSYSARQKIFGRDGFDESGKWARFLYSDHHGKNSRRTIVNWSKRGIYIVGYDRSKGAERTFRQDQISEWQSG